MTNLARTPKSAIFWDFAKGGPRENAQKSRPTIGASKTPWRKWHHLRVMTNLARTPKSAIFWDFAKGGPRENAQKSRPTIGASKTPWRKWPSMHLKCKHRTTFCCKLRLHKSLWQISMHLKCKHRTTFCCKLRLHKCPYSRVMTNLARTPKSAIFWDFAKGGPRENAQKSRPTIGPYSRVMTNLGFKNTLAQMASSPN